MKLSDLLSSPTIVAMFTCIPLCHASIVLPSFTNMKSVEDDRQIDERQHSSITDISISNNNRALGGTHGRILKRTSESGSWLQIGDNLDGRMISLSENGMRMVTHASRTSPYKPSLIARVHEQDINGEWVQVGNDIDYKTYKDLSDVKGFILRVDISSNGERILIGTLEYNSISRKFPFARIFEEVNGLWTQIGNAITDESTDDYYTIETKISGDGMRVIVGAVWNNDGDDKGNVRVFEESNDENGDWVQVGDVTFVESWAKVGHSFDITRDGKRIIAGVYFQESYYSYNTGTARVFEEKDGTWTQVGLDLEDHDASIATKYDVSVSLNGKRILVGASDSNGGFARIFEEKGGEWVQIGNEIKCEDVGSVHISHDGASVAIGMPYDGVGQVRIFKDTNEVWVQVGGNIYGDKIGDKLGSSISISGDGNRVALKAGLTSSQKSYSRVYELTVTKGNKSPKVSKVPKGVKMGKISKATKAPKLAKASKKKSTKKKSKAKT